MKILIAMLVILTLSCFNAFATERMSYPFNSRKPLKSPDGLNSVFIRGNSEYALELVSKNSKRKKVIYKFSRTADVFWSPDSKYLTINDHVGSNISEAHLYRVDGGKLINLTDLLMKSLQNEVDKANIANSDHIYFSATKWLDKNTLQIHVTGHGVMNPKGFTVVYNLKMNGTSKAVKRLSVEAPPEECEKKP